MSTTTVDLDEQTYGQLLGRTLPHVIHTDEESERLTNELLRQAGPCELLQAGLVCNTSILRTSANWRSSAPEQR